MKPRLSLLLVSLVVCVHVAHSQQSPRFDTGTVTNGTYTNECFGFSLLIPFGWQVNSQVAPPGQAIHTGKGSYGLLMMDRPVPGNFGDRIAILANEAQDSAITPRDIVGSNVQNQIKSDPERRHMLREPFPVDYGGKRFFRSDYKQTFTGGKDLYFAFVFTKFRGYFLGASLIAVSPERLDEAANALRQISFQSDEPNPACIAGGENPKGIIVGIIGTSQSPHPSNNLAPSSTSSGPVRLSPAAAQALLIHRTDAKYPGSAWRKGIEGKVEVKASVDKEGNVKEVALLSGDQHFAQSALDAIKNWKYKPYLLQGQPVEFETTVAMEFKIPPIRFR